MSIRRRLGSWMGAMLVGVVLATIFGARPGVFDPMPQMVQVIALRTEQQRLQVFERTQGMGRPRG